MPQFKYKARDEHGKLYQNTILSESSDQARNQLIGKGYWVLELSQVKEKSNNPLDFELDGMLGDISSVGLRDLVIFCRQFATLINSGVAVVRSLTILGDQSENKKLGRIIGEIKTSVEQGTNLSEAFSKYPKVFDNLFISMLKAGETGGILDEVLNRIAKFMEEKAKLNNKIKSAMAYPSVVTVAALVIFFVMLTVILPKFSEIFNKLGSELPAYTQFLVNISDFLISAARFPMAFVVIFIFISIYYGFKKIYSIEAGRYTLDSLVLKAPILGSLVQKVSVARFTRTFGTLIKSGVPILTALEIVEESSGNAVVARAVKNIKEEVKQGGMVYTQLDRQSIFPPMVVSMIAVGEETGELDAMLAKIADFYDVEVETTVEALTSLIEPIMMLFLGGIVGSVIVGMYLPMFKIFEAVSN